MFIRVTGISYKSEEKQTWDDEADTLLTYYTTSDEIEKTFKSLISIKEIERIEAYGEHSIIYFKSGEILNTLENIKQLEMLLIVGNLCHLN